MRINVTELYAKSCSR